MTDRHDLRRQLRAYRRTLSAADRLRAAEAVAHRLESFAPVTGARVVAGYWAVDGELPLHEVVGHVLRRAQIYALPTLVEGKRLAFRSWRPGEPLAPNRYGIPEPVDGTVLGAETLDVVLVPLLAFDARGNRLGSGAGYYDRSFAFRRAADRAGPLLVGVGYGFQLRDALPVADWDVPLDFACTDSTLIDCRSARRGAS